MIERDRGAHACLYEHDVPSMIVLERRTICFALCVCAAKTDSALSRSSQGRSSGAPRA